MFIYYLLLFLAAVMTASTVGFDKYYQKHTAELNNVECALRKAIPGLAITGVTFLIVSGFQLKFSLFSFMMGILLSFINILANLVCFRAYGEGSLALFTMFRMQGGMLLPYVYGIIFADNNPSVCQIIGIVVMIVALSIPYLPEKKRQQKFSGVYVLMCLLIFFINGGISIVSYIQSNSPLAVDTNSFMTIYHFQCTIIFIIVYAIWCLKHRDTNLIAHPPVRPKKQTALLRICALSSGLIGSVSYFMQLIGASNLPAVVIYPMFTGGMVVLTSLMGRIMFHEKLSVRGYIGVAATFAATVLFAF